jgi:hypothetical protein
LSQTTSKPVVNIQFGIDEAAQKTDETKAPEAAPEAKKPAAKAKKPAKKTAKKAD